MDWTCLSSRTCQVNGMHVKTGNAQEQRTREKWKDSERQSMAVVMRQQYRIREQLAEKAERFAKGEQLMDAKALVEGNVMKRKNQQ